MSLQCPKCGKPVSADAVYCAYCGHGLKPSATTVYTHLAVAFMIVATVGSMVIFILSALALQGVYSWYPQFVAQQWFVYDQLLTVFSFSGFVFGTAATVFILSRKSADVAIASAGLCTLSGAGVFTVSLIQPLPVLWQSILYYFLPLFIVPLTGNLLAFLRKEEIGPPKQKNV